VTGIEEERRVSDQGLTGHSRLRSLIYPFKVIVFPFRTFREITQNLDSLKILPGFVLVIALQLLTSLSIVYVRASRIFLDSETHSASLLTTDFLGTNILPILLQGLLSLLLNWITYAVLLLLIARVFSQKRTPLNPSLLVVGYTFSVLVVSGVATTLLVSLLPEIHFDAPLWFSGAPEDIAKVYEAVWGPTLVLQVLNYLGLVFMFWLVMLGAIVVKIANEIRFTTAIMISFVAYFLSALITAFLST